MFTYILLSYIVICIISTFLLRKLFNKAKEELLEVFDNTTILEWLLIFFIVIITLLLLHVFLFALSPIILCINWKDPKVGIKPIEKEKEIIKEKEQEQVIVKEQEQEQEQDIDKEKRTADQIQILNDEIIQPDIEQIFYIETSYNAEINDFFKRNYTKVTSLFSTKYNPEYAPDVVGKGFTFIYLPFEINKRDFDDLQHYSRPDLAKNDFVLKKQIIDAIQQKFVEGLNSMNCCNNSKENCQDSIDPQKITSTQGFIHFKHTELNTNTLQYEDIYTYFPLTYENDEQFFNLIIDYIEHTGTLPTIFYKRRPTPPNEQELDDETQKITEEILEMINKLRGKGFNNFVLKQLLFPPLKLSKLKITTDYRIFLVDYDNTEITMPTLSKALFFLYLRHPTGIPFKTLPDYKDELLKIYKKVTNRDNIAAMEKSIENLTNPIENSINEKCSRIRYAFIKEFDENISQHYYITTKENDENLTKVISLDRNLIIDEAGILSKTL